MMVRDDDIGIALFVDGFKHSPNRMKELFIALDGGFWRLGTVPTRLSASREGKGGNYRTYRGLKPRLMPSEFSDVRGFTLECLLPGRPIENYKSWTGQAWVHKDQETAERTYSERWQAFWMVFPDDAGVTEQRVLDELLTFARLAVDEYAYIVWMRRGAHPTVFDMSMGLGGEGMFRTKDEAWNRATWTNFGCWTRRLLRDVFPINFLDRARLSLPIAGGTLEQWIRADPAERGTVEPFNDRVWIWRPVIERIPFIREPLFRAGILHWYGFFMTNDCSRRQVPAPPPGEWFKIPDQTPDMFLPDRYTRPIPKIPPRPPVSEYPVHEPSFPATFLGHHPKITN